ncbi:cellulose binding domain-containing protein [Actinocorallia herbida]|uniref:Cellulose binding domain-containing protein n=1 Tax=Actinocorallia herbida TaxID=58109 RepID=A0A3N1CRQ5_9ACTN|nr:cellulose binding domain-containing protein [Actinocorallia herbida]ROO83368.1 cellulose binding domain-containing protein [Actinocorallia herbida]
MGRHTKFWDRPVFADRPPVPSPVEKVRMAWIGRTPLMPTLAGVAALGVITAAFLTQEIPLDFASPGAERPESASCAGCDSMKAEMPAAGAPVETAAPDAERSAAPVTPPGLRASFKLDKTTGSGFTAVLTLRNTGDKAVTGWKLRFRLPNAVVQGADGATVQMLTANGGVTVLDGTASIAPGGTLRVPFTGEGAWSNPTSCRVNGLKCR